ncbi:MAG: hypothetical protein HY300_09285 [Verrucomicrobia bacterium]|nr:hypothetical protein [Verrucomicrobiota bacterium]
MESLQFIRDRSQATRDVQAQIAGDWVWEEKTLAQWDADLVAYDAQVVVESQKSELLDTARSAYNNAEHDLHGRTVQALIMARARYRHDPVKLGVIANLTAAGDTQPHIEKEGLDWESAWEDLDPAWSPVATNTLAAFTTLRGSVGTLHKDYSLARKVWRKQAETLNHLAAQLEDNNVAWYTDATAAFADGTPNGNLIRTIPTTDHGSGPTPPPPAPPGP